MNTEPLPLSAQLIRMGYGFMYTKLVYMAASLNLGERFTNGPRSSDAVAKELELHPPFLYRFMRALAGEGILTEVEEGVFGLTTLGECLKPDHPDAAYASILASVSPAVIAAWEKFPEVLQTGKTGFNLAFGQGWFEWLSERPGLSTQFNQSMAGVFGKEPLHVAAAYDFSVFDSIADVGGGNGNGLSLILSQHQGPRGLVFDQPHVVAEAPALLSERGMSARIATQGGNFFASVPAGFAAYILSHIIHDWDDNRVVEILENCRRAIKPDGKLLILEWVLPEGDTPHVAKVVDINMMMLMGGEERTAKQYGRLLAQAGFRMIRVIPTRCECSIVEAVPV
ncbi:MAG: methyltransferase [Gammaproteobacteria bacterium]|nr:methyltransferase [Gammaproteobacteria bacterium]